MDVVMTIAGSDSGGGAGIQADIKTFQELKVFGTSVITALTAQNTMGVEGIFPATKEFVEQQMIAVLKDFDVTAVKTGMLFSAEIIEVVAQNLKDKDLQLVIDPVMIAKGGASLLQVDAVHQLTENLLPLATILTPNIPEAEVISQTKIESHEDIQLAAKRILNCGVECVVIKGGHLLNETSATDRIFFKNGSTFSIESKRIHTRHTHGTGCTFSAAITAFLGKGYSIEKSVIEAKKFVQLAIENSLNLGSGNGPTNHFAYQEFLGEYEVIVK